MQARCPVHKLQVGKGSGRVPATGDPSCCKLVQARFGQGAANEDLHCCKFTDIVLHLAIFHGVHKGPFTRLPTPAVCMKWDNYVLLHQEELRKVSDSASHSVQQLLRLQQADMF